MQAIFSQALCLFAACSLTVVAAPASAMLILNIDADNDTFFFSGSASGNPVNDMGTKTVVWSLGTLSGTSASFIGTDVGLEVTSNSFVGASPTLQIFGDAPGGIQVEAVVQNNSSTDFAGIAGMPQVTTSYGSLSAAEKTYFESLIGSSIPLGTGSGFGPINVIAAVAVPEPSMALAGSFLLVGFGSTLGRRKIRG